MDLLGTVLRQVVTWRKPDLAMIKPTPPAKLLHLRNGTTVVTSTPPPTPDAPTVVLLHGLACTGALCWAHTIPELAKVAGIVTFDQRWHGQGIDSAEFSLEDCADDVADVLDQLNLDQAIIAGYSLGGAVAQLVWQRHPDRVSGLILCSIARNSRGAMTERLFLPVYDLATALVLPYSARRVAEKRASLQADDEQNGSVTEESLDSLAWVRAQTRSTSLWACLHAAQAFTAFNSAPWISRVNVPTAVVVTDSDRAIPTRRQRALAGAIPDATMHHAPGGHASLVLDSTRWVPVFLNAFHDVAHRIAHEGAHA